jgi:hypothetical protein
MPEIGIQQNIFGAGNYVVGQGTINIIQQLPELDREGYRNLTILRDKVRQFWIGGVLEKSVHGEALIALGRQSVADAVDHPWASTLELPDQKSQIVPSGKKTSEAFYECGRALLILGEPGSGKTITLLELARDLIQKSEVDPTQPVPVIFNLSSWSARQQPLLAWLIEELKTKYFVSRKLGELWLQENRLLLLLDGLDEVIADARSSCVATIHKHIEEQGSSGIVVCCRIADYTTLPLKLKLNAAICVQPLTSEQIDQYLQHSGEGLAALRQAVNDDVVLNDLAQTPLMLSIMSLAYQEVTSSQLKADGLKTLQERRKHIFEQYVERMFSRRQQTGRAFGKANTKDWLAGLAQQMTGRAQTVFLVEGLQPDWLPRRGEHWIYFMISRGVSGMLLFAALVAILAVCMGPDDGEGLLMVIVIAWAGIVASSIEPLLILRRKQAASSSWKETFKRIWIYGGLSGLFAGVGTWLSDVFESRQPEMPLYILMGLLAANVYGGLFGLIFGFRASRQSVASDTQTVESLAWSWRNVASCIPRGILIGALVSVSAGFAVCYAMDTMFDGMDGPYAPIGLWKLTIDAWRYLLVYLAVGGVGGAILAVLFGGLVRVATRSKTRPNEGIRLSRRNALRSGAFIGLGLGIMLWTAIVWFDKSPGWTKSILNIFPWGGRWILIPIGGAISAVFLGLAVALWYGGLDIIQHYTLRLLLWIRGYEPFRLVRFLDHASDLIFLQKVGGGYIFIHRLLLEHFAAKKSKWSAQPAIHDPGT